MSKPVRYALLVGALLLGCQPPPSPAPVFSSPGEAWRFILARMHARAPQGPGDLYSESFHRSYTTLDGKIHEVLLVATPERELEVAEGFAAHGFAREAAAHYENLIAYYPDTLQGKTALTRLGEVRRNTARGRIPPLTVVFRDGEGRLFAPGSPEESDLERRLAAGDLEGALDRIHQCGLERATPTPESLEPAGFIDDAGGIIRGASPGEGRASTGVLAASRVFYLLPHEARTLEEAERLTKGTLFPRLAERAGPPGPANAPLWRRAADAMLYLGRIHDAGDVLEALGEGMSVDPVEDALRLDAHWPQKVRENPRLILSTRSAVTTKDHLEVEVEANGIERIAFSLAKLKGPLPADETRVKDWFRTAAAEPAHTLTLPLPAAKSKLRLPLPPGAYRVTAEARGLSCAFLAVRADAALEAFILPQEMVILGRPGLTLATGPKVLGTLDAEGLLSVAPNFFSSIAVPDPAFEARGIRVCAEHKECCSGCDSCGHHHVLTFQGAQVFASGHGQFFRARVKAAPPQDVKAPASGPVLFVHTDRPVYKAGDTLRFRGILRLPKEPFHRSDPCRFVAAPEQEVALALRCGDTLLFQRTYVTGDQGTFAGEFTLPLTAFRTEYKLTVEHKGADVSQAFEVVDYRKNDYAITLTPAPNGARVEGGYVWGAPVPGSRIRTLVEGKEVAPRDGFVALKDGEHLRAELLRGEEELAVKSFIFRAPAAALPAPAPAPQGSSAAAPASGSAPAEAKPAPTFTVSPSRPAYGRGETIELEVAGPWAEAEATVVLADVRLYDFTKVPIRNGRGVAKFPARAIHDPGVTAFALCNGLEARAPVRVHAARLKVEIDAPAAGRPSEEVEVKLRTEPGAALAFAAVDEAIFMIREDDTPAIYEHFFPERPAALAHARFEEPEFTGETHKLELPPTDLFFKPVSRIVDRPFRGKGTYEVIGGGGGGGGRYGHRLGGRRNLVARGGGGGDTEDAVLGGLRWLSTQQAADGSWAAPGATEAGTLSDVGMTGLGLLAFLGAGYSHLSKDTYGGVCFGDVVRKGLQRLMSLQSPEGRIGTATGDWILNHSLAALALSEGYGLTGSELYKNQANLAVNFLAGVQSANGGWHRSEPTRPGEILPGAFAVMAFKSAQLAGLMVPAAAASNAFTFFNGRMGDDGLIGSPPTRATVGAGILSLIFLRPDKGDPRLAAAAGWLARRADVPWGSDYLGAHLGALGVFQYDGPSGPLWRRFHEPLKAFLIPAQKGSTRGAEGPYIAALSSLGLEIYYRYANVFGTRGEAETLPPLAPAPRLRVHFPDTVFWAPELVADPRGEARVSFKLPDQITTTRLTARGVTRSGGAGEAVGRIRMEQPFFLKIRAPEFAVADDEIEVRVDAFNFTGQELEATVRLEGHPGQKVLVPADRPAGVSWRVRAEEPFRLVAYGRAGGHEDSVERRIRVLKVGRESLASARGKGRTGESFPFEAPAGVQDLVVKVHPRKGSLTQVLDALRYLNQYPYG